MDAIKNAISGAKNTLLVTHVDPDGDAIGSLTAMSLALLQLGHPVTPVCDDGVPNRFRYLPLADKVQRGADLGEVFDLVIALDCGDEQRMGRAYSSLSAPTPPVINIDHHVTNTEFGAVNLVDPAATSTTEILYDLFAALNVEITAEIAISLLTGLVTDTLGFRTVGVTAKTLKIAGALVDVGADISMITMQALNLKPLSTMRMWQLGLNHMRLEGGLVWASLTNKELKDIGFTSPSSAGLVNLFANIEEAVMSAVLLEQPDGTIRVGFRSRPPYSVAEVAQNLGGGGHPLAAGCTLDGPLGRAEALVVGMCQDAIQQQTAASDLL